MTKYLIISLIVILVSCKQDKPEHSTVSLFPLQPSDAGKLDQLIDKELSETLQLLQEKDLRDSVDNVHEFRCYYLPQLENYKYFRLNFEDSILTIKEYRTKLPDGSGQHTVFSTRTIKFTSDDFEVLDKLITNSLFWSLDKAVYPYVAIDGISYIYEYRWPWPIATKNRFETRKKYKIVSTRNPKNSDLINLGQFFALKGGYKNFYRN
ncbi:MAG: hypothetical protein V4580_19190 [Bacteroidota bacterium]